MAQITFTLPNNKTCQFDTSIVMNMFVTMRNMLGDTGEDVPEIPLDIRNPADDNEVLSNKQVMTLIREWCEYHHEQNLEDNPEFKYFIGESETPEDFVSNDATVTWDNTFFGKMNNEDELIPMLVVADYMACKFLIDGCVKAIAKQFKEKTPEQIRQHFHIKDDLTDEEKTRIEEENKWLAPNN